MIAPGASTSAAAPRPAGDDSAGVVELPADASAAAKARETEAAAEPADAPAAAPAAVEPAPAVEPDAAAASTGPAAAEDPFEGFDDEFADEKPKRAFDPLMGYNRMMFKVNDKLYFWFLKPVARGYGFILPEFLRTSISRGFANLGFPLRFVNSGIL